MFYPLYWYVGYFAAKLLICIIIYKTRYKFRPGSYINEPGRRVHAAYGAAVFSVGIRMRRSSDSVEYLGGFFFLFEGGLVAYA